MSFKDFCDQNQAKERESSSLLKKHILLLFCLFILYLSYRLHVGHFLQCWVFLRMLSLYILLLNFFNFASIVIFKIGFPCSFLCYIPLSLKLHSLILLNLLQSLFFSKHSILSSIPHNYLDIYCLLTIFSTRSQQASLFCSQVY